MAPRRRASRKVRAASGNACTTTGPIPGHVVFATTDSNSWGGGSGQTYTVTRRPDGLTDIDVVFVREGKDLKVWLLGLVVGTIGKGVLEKAFKNSVTAIEARNAFPTACRCG